MAGRTLALCPGATASWYDGVGHMSSWEVLDGFDHELAGLARKAAFMTTNTTLAGQCDRPTFVVVRQGGKLANMRKKLAKETGLPDLVHPGAPTFELSENHIRGKQEPER